MKDKRKWRRRTVKSNGSESPRQKSSRERSDEEGESSIHAHTHTHRRAGEGEGAVAFLSMMLLLLSPFSLAVSTHPVHLCLPPSSLCLLSLFVPLYVFRSPSLSCVAACRPQHNHQKRTGKISWPARAAAAAAPPSSLCALAVVHFCVHPSQTHFISACVRHPLQKESSRIIHALRGFYVHKPSCSGRCGHEDAS